MLIFDTPAFVIVIVFYITVQPNPIFSTCCVRDYFLFNILREVVLVVFLQSSQLHTLNMACKEVSKLSDTQVREWFNSFDTVMTDCDGVLWVGAEAIPGSPDMVRRY